MAPRHTRPTHLRPQRVVRLWCREHTLWPLVKPAPLTPDLSALCDSRVENTHYGPSSHSPHSPQATARCATLVQRTHTMAPRHTRPTHLRPQCVVRIWCREHTLWPLVTPAPLTSDPSALCDRSSRASPQAGLRRSAATAGAHVPERRHLLAERAVTERFLPSACDRGCRGGCMHCGRARAREAALAGGEGSDRAVPAQRLGAP